MGIFTNAFAIPQYVVDRVFDVEFNELDAVNDGVMLGRSVLFKKSNDTQGIAIKIYNEGTLTYKELNIQPSDWVIENNVIYLDGGEIE